MCASYCGGRIGEETYWIDALGQRHKVEICLSQPLHDELVYELAARCQCNRYTQERPL